MHTHAGSACDDSMTLTSGILTSRSLMPRDCLSSVVLIAQAYLFLECGHKTDTHRHSLTPMAIDVLLLTVDVVGDWRCWGCFISSSSSATTAAKTSRHCSSHSSTFSTENTTNLFHRTPSEEVNVVQRHLHPMSTEFLSSEIPEILLPKKYSINCTDYRLNIAQVTINFVKSAAFEPVLAVWWKRIRLYVWPYQSGN